jgi:hypothetical protein
MPGTQVIFLSRQDGTPGPDLGAELDPDDISPEVMWQPILEKFVSGQGTVAQRDEISIKYFFR